MFATGQASGTGDPFSFSLIHMPVEQVTITVCVLVIFLLWGNNCYKGSTSPALTTAPSAVLSALNITNPRNTLWGRPRRYSTLQRRHRRSDNLPKGTRLPGGGIGIPTQASRAPKE